MLDQLRRLGSTLSAMVTRGKIAQATVGPRTMLQVTGLDNETFDEVELLVPPGYVAVPAAGGDALILQANGSRDHKVALGGDAVGVGQAANAGPGDHGIRAQGGQIMLRVAAIEILKDGETPQLVVLAPFMSLFNAHTHDGGSPPDQKMTAAHLSTTTVIGGS